MLLLTDHALSILDLEDSLLMFLIGEMSSSMVISFVQKSRTIPSSLSVLTPKMRSNADLVIFFPSYSHNTWGNQNLLAVGVLSELEVDFSSSFCVEGLI